MKTFQVSSSGCTIGTFKLAEVTVEAVSIELSKLGILDISDKQLQSIVEHGQGATFKFCGKARKAIPTATVRDISGEVKFHKALDIVNKYNQNKLSIVAKMGSGDISMDTFLSIARKANKIGEEYGLGKVFS